MAVAPTQQGKSYSDMVNEQIGLIQRQRAANLNQRLAQEEKNREFRTEQLQNIYDFDVSGLASGDVQALGKVQRELAASLDPNSEFSYSNSQQLVSDIALINNAYNEMKRWGETGMAGRQSYQNGILQTDRGDGTVNVGNEESLNSKNEIWEKGAFAEDSVRLVGPPGNRQLVGMALDVDGNEIGEVGFFEHPSRNQPDQFWRMEIGQGDPMNVGAQYADNTNIDSTNVNQRAANTWDNNPTGVQNRFRMDKAKTNGLSIDDIKNENNTFIDGYTDEDLRSEYINEAKEGLNLRKRAKTPSLFSPVGADGKPSRTIAELTAFLEPIKINTTDEGFGGKVVSAGLVTGLDLNNVEKDSNGNLLIPINAGYPNSEGTVDVRRLEPGTDAYQQFMQIVGEADMGRMFDEAYPKGEAPSGNDKGDKGGDSDDFSRFVDAELSVADLDDQRIKAEDEIKRIEEEYQSVKQQYIDEAPDSTNFFNRLFGSEDKASYADRPLTEFMGPSDIDKYNQAKETLTQTESELARLKEIKNSEPVKTEPSFKTEKGKTYTADQLEPNLEDWEKSLRAGDKGVKSGVAVIAKNFGNLRPNTANPYRSGVYEVSSDNKYQNFSSYEDGLKGLIWDVKSKQHKDGLSSNVVSKGDSIMQAIKEYAPAADKNNPESYAKFVVDFVNEQTGGSFTVDSKASELPTQFLVEAIIMKEDISLYNEMKDRGFFGNRIAEYSQGISKNNLV